jgi:hypothetical protein
MRGKADTDWPPGHGAAGPLDDAQTRQRVLDVVTRGKVAG